MIRNLNSLLVFKPFLCRVFISSLVTMWSVVMLTFIGMVSGLKLTDPVNTPSGQIQGIFSADGKYSKFYGIPYAQVNAKNPFGISTPHPGFGSIYDATNDSLIMCPQPPDSGITITLDCLKLNIFAPNNAGQNMPVLVWIYGGGYRTGYARLYDNENFIMNHNVIFVSLNYRLGPYGFMCLGTEEIPGNQGLRDQHLAFKWISENIAAFGGDPSRITAMGTSSGAIGLDLYLQSEVPKFFNQVILQSGSRYYPYTITTPNETVPVIMAKQLGYDTRNITEALSLLATASTKSVIAAYSELGIVQRPCVENKFPNVDTIISSHPEHDIDFRKHNISILSGFNDQEGFLYYNMYKFIIEELDEQTINSFFRVSIDQEFDTSEMDAMVDKVRRFYLGDVKVKEKQGQIIDFLSDFFNISPSQRSIIKHAAAGVRVYQYLFSYDGGRNYIKKLQNIKLKGASHGDETGYIFDMPVFREKPTIADKLTIDRMTTMWTNFVKYGNPTPTTCELLPVIWPPVTEDVVWYLNIGANLTLGTRPYRKRMLFWDLFYVANQDKLWANVLKSYSSVNGPSVLRPQFIGLQ